MTVYEFLEHCKINAWLEKNYHDVEFLKMAIENLTIAQAEQIIRGKK